MALSPPKWIKLRGPKFLQEILKQIQDEITFRSPLPGCGISISEEPTGRVISTKIEEGGSSTAPSPIPQSGGSATVIATEFVSASNGGVDSGEILYSHDIGAGRLANDGDCIRAIYSVRVNGLGANAIDVIVRFGAENDGAAVIINADNFDFDGEYNVKIEVLIIRSSSASYRFLTSMIVSQGYNDTNGVRCWAGGSLDDNSLDLSENQFLTLWGGAFNPDAAAGMVKARMALIEYIPA